MRTEIEIRSALKALGGEEQEKPVSVEGGTFVPMNGLAKDLLRWVLSEPSSFGKALDAADRAFAASDRAARN